MARKIPSIDETTKALTPEVVAANSGTTAQTFAGGADTRITGAAQKSANLSDLANLVTARTNLRSLGVDRTGATDVQPQLQAALDAAAADVQWTRPNPYGDPKPDIPISRPVEIPPGSYRLDAPLVVPQGVDLVIHAGARLVAGAAMAVLLDTPQNDLLHRQTIDVRGLLDCNDLAATGFYARYFAHLIVPNLNVQNATTDAVILGDPDAEGGSYEHIIGSLDVWRGPRNAAVPVGSRGVWVRRSTDGTHHEGKILGYDIGMQVDDGGCLIYAHHVWGFPGREPSISFKDYAPNSRYIGCEPDSPVLYGFYLGGSGTSIMGMLAFKNQHAPDNTATAIYLGGDTTLTPTITVEGRIQGTTSANRWAADVALGAGVKPYGLTWDFSAGRTNVASNYGAIRQMGSVPNTGTLALQSPASGTAALVQTLDSSRAALFEMHNTGTSRQRKGGHRRNVLTVTGSTYALTEDHDLILSSRASSGTITLPDAATTSSRQYTIRVVGAGAITVDSAGGLVDGGTSVRLVSGDAATFANDGTGWWSVHEAGDRRRVVTVTGSPYTVTGVYDMLLINRTSAGVVTLPDPAVSGSGREFTIRAIGTADSSVQTAAGLVDGGASVTVTAGTAKRFVSDGTGWWSA